MSLYPTDRLNLPDAVHWHESTPWMFLRLPVATPSVLVSPEDSRSHGFPFAAGEFVEEPLLVDFGGAVLPAVEVGVSVPVGDPGSVVEQPATTTTSAQPATASLMPRTTTRLQPN
ncbi:hypothetical protein GCM10029964_002480 [Kibdelosporangium lantanae]